MLHQCYCFVLVANQGSSDALAEALQELFVALSTRLKLTAPHAGPDLSFSEGRVLMTVGQSREPLAIHAIAEQLGISIATAGRNVDRLVREGVVTREESATDRRVKLVSTTRHGRELLAAHVDAHRAVLREFADQLPREQRDALDAAIRAALVTGVLEPGSLPAHVTD